MGMKRLNDDDGMIDYTCSNSFDAGSHRAVDEARHNAMCRERIIPHAFLSDRYVSLVLNYAFLCIPGYTWLQ